MCEATRAARPAPLQHPRLSSWLSSVPSCSSSITSPASSSPRTRRRGRRRRQPRRQRAGPPHIRAPAARHTTTPPLACVSRTASSCHAHRKP
eukprot:2624402-Prymnesium_polylepis.1